MVDVARNLGVVRERMAAAAARARRDLAEVTLIAVSKTRGVEEIADAAAAGAVDFGENYVQELVDKHEALASRLPDLNWHFIGHLQRNKVRFLVPFCALVQVVDSARLAEELDRRAEQAGRVQPVLLQVDLAGEETKFGCAENEVFGLAERLAELEHVDWQGLMTIPPMAHEAEAARPYYVRLREVRDGLLDRGVSREHLRHLSMGMSNDYEVAIEEGATLIRVGTAIFGPRQ